MGIEGSNSVESEVGSSIAMVAHKPKKKKYPIYAVPANEKSSIMSEVVNSVTLSDGKRTTRSASRLSSLECEPVDVTSSAKADQRTEMPKSTNPLLGNHKRKLRGNQESDSQHADQAHVDVVSTTNSNETRAPPPRPRKVVDVTDLKSGGRGEPGERPAIYSATAIYNPRTGRTLVSY